MRTITCFGDQTSGTFLIIGPVSLMKIHVTRSHGQVQTDNFVNVNVFNSVTSPHVLSCRCILYYLLTIQVGGIKIVIV